MSKKSQKIPKIFFFTKGVQYVNVRCNGFLKWKSAAKVRQLFYTEKHKTIEFNRKVV